MASKVTYNDFRGGMLSERMRRRTDLENFYSTASLIRNAVPMRAGGLRLRPGIRQCEASHELDPASRIFTYTISDDESYSIVVTPGRLYIYGSDGKNIRMLFSDSERKEKDTREDGFALAVKHALEDIAAIKGVSVEDLDVAYLSEGPYGVPEVKESNR